MNETRPAAAAPGGTWTVKRALLWTAERFKAEGIETARLDAELLLAATLGTNRLGVLTRAEAPLSDAERGTLRELVRRRLAREPVAYILGRKDWLDLELDVGPGVLVPRPETEFVVDACTELQAAGELPTTGDVADFGSGSGAIAIALARRLARPVVAVERDETAAAYARRNVERYGAAVAVVVGDWADELRAERFALVAANPPYVAERERVELSPEVAHEPAAALFAGAEGLDAIAALAAELPAALVPGGWWVCECGAGQRPGIEALLARHGWASARWWRDFRGIDRVFAATPVVS